MPELVHLASLLSYARNSFTEKNFKNVERFQPLAEENKCGSTKLAIPLFCCLMRTRTLESGSFTIMTFVGEATLRITGQFQYKFSHVKAPNNRTYITNITEKYNTVFIRLLAAIECKPHQMVLKNKCKPSLIASRLEHILPKPLRYLCARFAFNCPPW